MKNLFIILSIYILISTAIAGEITNSTLINDCESLQHIDQNLDAYFELENDIDCTNYYFFPIGSNSDPFTGTINGHGYTISNLSIIKPDAENIGLFSATEDASITNLNLENANIEGIEAVGILIGKDRGNTNISNINASGQVTAGSESRYIGGLVGYAGLHSIINDILLNINVKADPMSSESIGGLLGHGYQVTVEDVHVNGEVTGKENVGGLIGSLYSYDNIYNTSTNVKVSGVINTGGLIGDAETLAHIISSHATGNVYGEEKTGGLVGLLDGEISFSYATGNVFGENKTGGLVGENKESIEESYATGDVYGIDDVGGLSGSNYFGRIDNSYATGNIEGTRYVGGLVGSHEGHSIQYNYSIGKVSGTSYVGGLVGSYEGYDTENNYWDVNSSGQLNSAVGIGKTTSEMYYQRTYEEWDFVNIWSIENSYGYPSLMFEFK
ncbi:MAG: GLUG motif-containing protein [Legionellales bacterium]|jgi:hypothetical protein